METQMKCYEVMTVSTGLCGSENCVLTDKNSSSRDEISEISVGSNKTR
jgi:hypothetical protein